MKKFLTLILVGFFIWSCSTVPVTGRRQLSLIPSSQLLPLSFNSYAQVLDSAQIVRNTPEAQMVNRVGNNIKAAVEKYMAQNNMSDQLQGFEWDFNLIKDDNMINAWAMPGGKVAFYTGILPVCRDETGVAVVMGHEVAHAIANHGGERMSQGLVQQLGGVALNVALRDYAPQTQQLAMTAFGLGSAVGYVLPHSRNQESEADEMGLIFMAMAGYDPNEAPRFWERMQAKSGGSGGPPEFLSTHPAPQRRIKDLQSQIPNAMKYYNKR
ncbi:MAG: M48 family metallopeptidase [Bacteroidota bacterium]|nr:M48 family metallopeptidase [Bacteroidota bacterium]